MSWPFPSDFSLTPNEEALALAFWMRHSPLEMEPAGRVRRGSTWRLRTPYQELEIYVSDTGRSLRVWDHKTGRELK